jgi:epoxyqueuosine reductase
LTSPEVIRLAHECGFELAGVALAQPSSDALRYREWVEDGMAGTMGYLTDRRAEVRMDPRRLLPSAQSIVCVGKVYNGPEPYSTKFDTTERAWISRYAWGDDYHDLLRAGLEALAARLRASAGPHDSKICVDTAPLLERSYARDAGLGWIGKNTCLINQYAGSWIFLGELLTSLTLEPGVQPPDRCGSCTRCIDACPTAALVPDGTGHYRLDARLCISYMTIECREPTPIEYQESIGAHVFGCDICQDVCPWNSRAAMTLEEGFAPRWLAPPLQRLNKITEEEFGSMFRHSPVSRARYAGFRRNIEIAMRNAAGQIGRVPG